jgi:RNA polymerase II subunit A-like phosphatase
MYALVDFFVGTGDINSSFLPKQSSTPPTSSPSVSDGAPGEPPQEPETSPVHEPVEPMDEQAEYVHKKIEERPLAKAQEVLEAANPKEKEEGAAKGRTRAESLEHRIRKAILNDDDRELERVEAILSHVHQDFYKNYEAFMKSRLNPMPHVGVSLTLAILKCT